MEFIINAYVSVKSQALDSISQSNILENKVIFDLLKSRVN